MIKHPLKTKTRIVLRTILSAGMLAVPLVLACVDVLKFSGEVAQLKGVQVTNIIWDAPNFESFC